MAIEPANVNVRGNDDVFVGKTSSQGNVGVFERADENRVPETDLFLPVQFIQSLFRAPVHAKAVHFVPGMIVLGWGKVFFRGTLQFCICLFHIYPDGGCGVNGHGDKFGGVGNGDVRIIVDQERFAVLILVNAYVVDPKLLGQGLDQHSAGEPFAFFLRMGYFIELLLVKTVTQSILKFRFGFRQFPEQ